MTDRGDNAEEDAGARVDRVAALRRTAFGRAESPVAEERAARARAELRRLEEEMTAPSPGPSASLSAPAVEASSSGGSAGSTRSELRMPSEAIIPDVPTMPIRPIMAGTPDGSAAPADSARSGTRRRPRRVVVVGTLVVTAIVLVGGSVASTVISRSASSAAASSAAHRSAVKSESRRFDFGTTRFIETSPTSLAGAWFAHGPTADDAFPYPVDNVVAASTRIVDTERSGWSLWVAKTSTGGFCLLTHRVTFDQSDPAVVSSCVSSSRFDVQGLSLSVGNATASWSGGAITVALRPGG